ncbi:MAG: right-handed parallel beta-helix repeat-containing protein [Candidatus Dormibacteraeota bacterium]|nr:right-handed parallel beta-helix repeat-containing protein [Candidatus Dormibacteraeota bacterium]
MVVAVLAAPAMAGTIVPHLAGACSGYSLAPADAPNIPSIVNQQPSGTVFCFAPGTYRMTGTINPKSGDQLVGAGTTRDAVILTGAKIISSWSLAGGLYVHTGDVVSLSKAGLCYSGTICQYADRLFMNDAAMTRVLSPCGLTNVTIGKYCVDYAAGKMYIFDIPTGQNLEYSYRPTAIGSSTGVIIKDMTITKFANPAASAAVIRLSDSSTMDNVRVANSHDCAVGIVGATGSVVKNSRLDHSGAGGYCGSSTGAIFTNNEVDHNNTLGFKASFEGGGGKFWNVLNITVTNNYVHDNSGNGLWFDGDSKGATVTGNTVSNNDGIYGAGNGITFEISCNATINSNVVSGSGLAGIQVRNSHDVTVGAIGAGNTVSGSAQYGIRLIADRTGTQTRCGSITASNNHVNENSVSMAVGASWTGLQRVSPAVANGDTFSGNHYHMPLATDCATGLRWKWWNGTSMYSVKFSGTGTVWQGTLKQDLAPGGTCGT